MAASYISNKHLVSTMNSTGPDWLHYTGLYEQNGCGLVMWWWSSFANKKQQTNKVKKIRPDLVCWLFFLGFLFMYFNVSWMHSDTPTDDSNKKKTQNTHTYIFNVLFMAYACTRVSYSPYYIHIWPHGHWLTHTRTHAQKYHISVPK